MEENIAITLCKLEHIFIPSFFDVMIHLPIHLATEAKLAGPVHYRWMYRFERAMQTYKSYVRNKAYPEGSIANGYIEYECLTFSSRYMSKIATQFNQLDRNEDIENPQPHSSSIFSRLGKPLGRTNIKKMTIDEWREAQLYVLKNCDEAQPFINEYENDICSQSIDLCKWFENRPKEKMTSEQHILQESEVPKLTYREQRRLDQAELRSKFPNRKRNWAQMNPEKKEQLYSKIMGKYNVPETVDGKPVIDSLSF
ncbi:uncharacterized protein LOC141634360 isoform X2 [Silene latifolia]|uniref:uncharacterized protein LOC141634360 isoform X2 n=1 Tax=Silene latifolia TaxID=37657 RepID=UPI003D78887D